MASHLPTTTFCWLPPDRVPATCSTPLQRIPSASIARRARRVSLANDRTANRARRPTSGRATLSVMEDLRCKPCVLRSSVTRARPSFRALRGERMSTALPNNRISPPTRPATEPKIVSRISVRPEPSNPPMPRISPADRSKLTPLRTSRQPRRLGFVSVRFLTERMTSRRAPGGGLDRARRLRPTIAAMTRSSSNSPIVLVSTCRPSRKTVTRSARCMTSSIRCEI